MTPKRRAATPIRQEPRRSRKRQVQPFQAGGFTETERESASAALLTLFRTEAQAVRSLILTFQHFDEVRQAVERAVPRLPEVMGRVTVRPGIRDAAAHVTAQREAAASSGATTRSR